MTTTTSTATTKSAATAAARVGVGGLWLPLATAPPSSASSQGSTPAVPDCRECRQVAADRRRHGGAPEPVTPQTLKVDAGRYMVRDLTSTWNRSLSLVRLETTSHGSRWAPVPGWPRRPYGGFVGTLAEAQAEALALLASPRDGRERSALIGDFLPRLDRRLAAVGIDLPLEVHAAAGYFAGDDIAGEALLDVVEAHRRLGDPVQARTCLTRAIDHARQQARRHRPVKGTGDRASRGGGPQ